MKISRLTLFTIVNLILFLTFVLTIYKDEDRQWKIYQKEFNKTQSDMKYPVQIRQLILSKLNRVDRCISCHTAIDKKGFEDSPQPLRSHPGDYLVKHPPERFGCSVCHEGQGLATTTAAAHGYVQHWDEPMLSGAYIQGSCGKCHKDNMNLPGMEMLKKGGLLYRELGCIGCHSVEGVGGNISVDLGDIADKPKEELDFTHLEGEKTVANWLYEHFKNPQKVTPARPDVGVPYPSPMPDDNLSDEDARALTTLMLSYTGESKKLPVEYYVMSKVISKPEPLSKIESGREVYYKFGCVGCHGKDGAGGISNYNAVGGKVPSLTYVAEGYTIDELKDKIRKGVQPVDKEDPKGPVPPLWMQRWAERINEKELDDLVAYLVSLMPKEEEEKWSE